MNRNTHSGDQFMKECRKQMDCEEDSVTWIADGRYSGKENEDLAKEKNVTLITTALKGPKTEDIAAGHKLSEDGKRVIHCPDPGVITAPGYTGYPTEFCN